MNRSKILSIIDHYEYVSFDLFDTLLKRNVENPNQIYQILEEKIGLNGFSKIRANSEVLLWNSSIQDFNFPNIYDNIKNLSLDFKEVVMKKEQELELKYSTLNYEMYEIYLYCLKKHKKVIFISDMYYDHKFILKLLHKNNINKFEKLYVSSDYNKTKCSGELFKFVLNDLNIISKNIVHIGDSFKSDYLMARKYHIRSIKIPTKVNYLYSNDLRNECKNLDESILVSFVNNQLFKIEDDYEKIGYETLGIFLIGFSSWLFQNCKRNNINQILFLSRDGFIMKKAFDKMYSKDLGLETNYFYASRRSLTVPMLSNINSFKDVFSIIKYRKKETFKNLLKRVGIEKLYVEDEYLTNVVFDRDEILTDDKVIALFDKYVPLIKENSKCEKENFMKYFKSVVHDKNVAIVDIGWHGTTQDCMEKLLGDKYNIIGYYLGLSEEQQDNKFSYAFDRNSKRFNAKLISAFRGIIETFFSANHGSVKRYILTDKFPNVELEEFTIKGQTSEIISSIHNGALKCVDDYKSLFENNNFNISGDLAFQSMYNVMVKPNLHVINLFKKISFFDTETRLLINSHDIKYYILHPKCFKNDFVESDWRIGFLKNIFKFANHCDKLVLIIYKIAGK